MRLLAATLSALVLVTSIAQAQTASPIPVEQFFQRPDTSGAAISPDGRSIAIRRLSPHGRMMLVVLDTESQKSRAVANFNNADIEQFFWLSDERIGFTTVNIDHGGEVGQTGLYAIDRDGSNRTMLRATIDRPRSFADGYQIKYDFFGPTSFDGFPNWPKDEMYVISQYLDHSEMVRLNTRTGRISTIRAPSETYHTLLDADGQPRVVVARRNELMRSYFRDGDSWNEFDSRDFNNNDGYKPLLYAEGQLYVRARNQRDEAGVYRYDIQNRTLQQPAMIVAPGFDTDGRFIVGERKMLGYRFNTDAATTVWFDPAMKALQQQIDEQFPGLVNLISRGRQSTTPYVLINTHSDIQSHAYLLYNSQTRAVHLLGSAMPELSPQRMSSMNMERFAARDGRMIPVFVTLPKHAGKQPFATVLLNNRNMSERNGLWDWNAEVQFLASRGYAVLQVSPRGSSGFGAQHAQSPAAGQTPDAITDLADAVQWAAKQGYTDPARVCIAGGGSGGHAALKSLLHQPQVFKCGISWSALVTPRSDPDSERLQQLRQPVLLAYDKDGERLDYQQGRKLYEALQAQQAPVQWLDYTTTVEDWKTQRPRIDLWRQIEAFLATHIGAPAH
jgi:dipeptidyl aminopeptidase/acylaminoacyl peptidase